jgi:hypothetical protein
MLSTALDLTARVLKTMLLSLIDFNLFFLVLSTSTEITGAASGIAADTGKTAFLALQLFNTSKSTSP